MTTTAAPPPVGVRCGKRACKATTQTTVLDSGAGSGPPKLPDSERHFPHVDFFASARVTSVAWVALSPAAMAAVLDRIAAVPDPMELVEGTIASHGNCVIHHAIENQGGHRHDGRVLPSRPPLSGETGYTLIDGR